MKKFPLLLIVMISFIVVVSVFLNFNYGSNIEKLSSDISDIESGIKSNFPEGSFIRDFQAIPNQQNKYLVIYIEKGYEFNSWDLSCPGKILGDAIIGKYHLAFIQDDKLINDIKIPPAYSGYDTSELTYRNYKDGWPLKGEIKKKEIIKLINFKDLTGDGLRYEFLLTTTGGGCGFYSSLVGAYDPEQNRAVLYSGWLSRFNPNSEGRYIFLFDCGDHGNLTRIEKEYQFNQNLKSYEVVWENKTPCN